MFVLCLVFFFACAHHANASPYSVYQCSYTGDCVDLGSKMPLVCNTTTMRCYVHASVCNALNSILAFVNQNPGFDIYFSTTTFLCTLANIPDCSNEAIILRSPSVEPAPLFCLYLNSQLTQPNTLITTLGPSNVIIFNPTVDTPPPTTSTVFTIAAPNTTLANLVFAATPVATQSAALIVTNANNLNITNCTFAYTSIAIIITSALQACANVSITACSFVNSRSVTATPILLMAAPCKGNITITQSPATPFVLLADPIATNTTYPTILDLSLVYAASIPPPPPPPPPPLQQCIESGLSKKTRVIVIVVGSIALFLLGLALVEYCRHHAPHKQLLLRAQLALVPTQLVAEKSD